MSARGSDSFWDMLTSHTKVAGGPSKLDSIVPAAVKEPTYKSKWTKEEEKKFKTCVFITTCGEPFTYLYSVSSVQVTQF